MNQLALETWEVPSACLSPASGEADALIEATWRGRRRQFLLRVVRLRDVYGCTFIREKDSEAIGNWLLVDRRYVAMQVWNDLSKPPLEQVASGIESGDLELARFCVVPDGKQTRRALTLLSGESLWLSAGMGRQEPFDLNLSEEAFLHDGRAHCAKVVEELSRPDSDARFAANWLRWTSEKKQRHIWGATRLQEVQAVMRSALQSQQWLWERADRWIWMLAAGADLPSLPYTPLRITDEADEKQVVFLELARLLMHYFESSPAQPELLAHRCVRDFPRWATFWPTVEVKTPPTHHERLEAHLYLSQWLRQNAPERVDLLVLL